jgi:PAS domain S-box-containing protein
VHVPYHKGDQMATKHNHGKRVETARERFSQLYQRFRTSPTEQALLPQALQQLSDSVEELTVTAEELRRQNEELVATRGLVEAERQHYKELFEFAPDGYIVTDLHGIIRETNSSAAKLLGVRQDLLVGKPIVIYMSKQERLFFYQRLSRLRRGEPVLNWASEIQPVNKASFHAELTVSAIPATSNERRLVALRWLVRDVTDRRAAEQRVETQLKRISVLRDINLAITLTVDLQTILEVLLDRLTLLFPYPIAATVRLIIPETGKLEHIICRGIDEEQWQAHAPLFPPRRTQEALRSEVPIVARNVQTDPRSYWPDFYIRNGLVSYLAARLTVKDEILGILCLYTKEEHEFSEEEIQSFSSLAVQASMVIYNSRLYEQLKKARDDLELRVEERTSELAKANEVLKSEIEERKQVEERLRESEGRLTAFANELEEHLIANDRLISVGELAASIAHEFNNPLQIILGFAQNLIQETSLVESEQQDLQIIEDEAHRCRDIIRNLLDFARPTTHEPIAIAIETIVRDCMNLVRAYLDKSNVNVDVQVPVDLPRIYGDPQHLKQVLINLFFNAADAMPTGGTLGIRAATEAMAGGGRGQLTVAVSDTGLGISPEAIPNIFRPFFTTKKKRGTGLGLSVCDRIIRAHGGSISVESKQGSGTTFYLRFPLMEKEHHGGIS